MRVEFTDAGARLSINDALNGTINYTIVTRKADLEKLVNILQSNHNAIENAGIRDRMMLDALQIKKPTVSGGKIAFRSYYEDNETELSQKLTKKWNRGDVYILQAL